MTRPLTCALLALTSAACVVDAPDDPVPSTVEVAVDPTLLSAFELSLPADLGVAVVWAGAVPDAEDPALESEFVIVGDDVPLPDPGVPVEVTLDPRLLHREGLRPTEPLVFGDAGSARVYRPRLVLYQDVDGSGRFEPPVLGAGGADRVLAVDELVSMAGILDLEDFLERQSPATVEALYAINGGLFTPFVPAVAVGNRLEAVLLEGPLPLVPGEPIQAAASLACLREVETWAVRAYFPWRISRLALHVDEGLDPVAVCGLVVDCVQEDLSALEPPSVRSVATPESLRVAQCRRNESLETLVIHQAEVVCEDCFCTGGGVSEAWVAARGAAPAWWPCGDGVAWCDLPGSLDRVDPDCFEEPAPEPTP